MRRVLSLDDMSHNDRINFTAGIRIFDRIATKLRKNNTWFLKAFKHWDKKHWDVLRERRISMRDWSQEIMSKSNNAMAQHEADRWSGYSRLINDDKIRDLYADQSHIIKRNPKIANVRAQAFTMILQDIRTKDANLRHI